ncbi:MAG TPA: hypothetical protein V6C90_00925 [Coleofasciculaceae cyanobacterium]
MDFEQALEVANAAVSTKIGRHLGDVETAILRGAWQDQTYEQIAETSGYSVSYLTRDIGPKLWKLLSQALGEPVSKTNFQAALERQWHKEDRERGSKGEGEQGRGGTRERGRLFNPKFKLRWKRTKGATQNPKSNRLGRIG